MSQAGLFSAVTSAFIIQVHSEFQQDPNEETAALLRVLIHKIDNTTFGGDVPTVPQWSGPTQMAVQVQAILLASLTASLFSAFLAMLGKQWLNRYASIDIRGSAIERCQNRQRKFNGVVAWYFDHVMESIPLMLQVALLLLGCALSRYLWEINTAVASVVVGVTSFGVLFYTFIIVAGAVSVSCPYQTPGAQILRATPDILRHILYIFRRLPEIIRRLPDIIRRLPDIVLCLPDIVLRLPDVIRRLPDIICRLPGIIRHILGIIRRLPDVRPWLLHIAGMFHSVSSASIKGSLFSALLTEAWDESKEFPFSPRNIIKSLLRILLLPIALIIDVFQLARAIVWGSVGFFHGVYSRLRQGLEHGTDMLDMQCILWTLRTSLDGPVRLSALNYLATKATLAGFDPALVVDCFDILLGCVKVTNLEAAVRQGLERLARHSALCLLQTLSHLTAIDPTSRVLEDVRQRYTTTFPVWTDLDGLPFSHTLGAIHCVFHPTLRGMIRRLRKRTHYTGPTWRSVRWEDYKLFNNEHIILAHALTKLAQFEYQKRQPKKVPRWLLHFALHFLSQDPLPPTSVITDCLSIIAIDLDCTLRNATTPDERCVHICQIPTSLIKN